MDIMNVTCVRVVGNEFEGYSVTFGDYFLNKRAAFKVAHHGWIVAHLEYMQRQGQLGEFTLSDTSDKAAK